MERFTDEEINSMSWEEMTQLGDRARMKAGAVRPEIMNSLPSEEALDSVRAAHRQRGKNG